MGPHAPSRDKSLLWFVYAMSKQPAARLGAEQPESVTGQGLFFPIRHSAKNCINTSCHDRIKKLLNSFYEVVWTDIREQLTTREANIQAYHLPSISTLDPNSYSYLPDGRRVRFVSRILTRIPHLPRCCADSYGGPTVTT